MFITNSKCLQCDGGLSPGLCCEITELDWHSYIQEDCRTCRKQMVSKEEKLCHEEFNNQL